MDNWFEKLAQLREEMIEEYDKDENLSTYNKSMNTIEDINPELSKKSKNAGVNSKYIFKNYISYENAEKIIKAVSNEKNLSISDYKREINNICINILRENQWPTELLIYATKAVHEDKNYVNAVIDVLKELYIVDNDFVPVCSHILRNWTWVEQLLIIIRSIVNIDIKQLGEELFHLFETNDYVREEAANAIISLKLEKYYEDILKLVFSMRVTSKETSGMILGIVSNMARSSQYGSECVFNSYLSYNSTYLDRLFISALRNNLSSNNLDRILKCATSENEKIQKKALHLLGKLKSKQAIEMLQSLIGNKKVNQEFLLICLGYSGDKNTTDVLKKCAENEKRSVKERTTAIISMANTLDEGLVPYIESFVQKSPEFEIAASSALVQLGKKDKLTNIFRYIIQNGVEDKYLKLSIREINRLRGLKMSDINLSLNKLSKAILDKDKEAGREFMVMNVLNMLTRGLFDNGVAEILLDKLMDTAIIQARIDILEWLGRNFSVLNDSLKEKARDSFVKCSESSNGSIRTKAMECLQVINKKESLTPTMKG